MDFSLFMLTSVWFFPGEPFLDGKVVSYDDKYHSDWIQVQNNDGSKGSTHPKEARGKQKKQ